MTTTAERTRATTRPAFRLTFALVESFVLVGAIVGVLQLWTGSFAPPVSDLQPLGLHDWKLPAAWLFFSVAIPSSMAVSAALVRLPRTPEIVLVASALLLVEVTVQIPFVGPSVLQAVMGFIAILLGTLAWLARRGGTWRAQRD